MSRHTDSDRAAAAALLGVPAGASPELLRAAWRTAVRHAHPDRGGDTERFIAVNAAYELLTTPPATTPARTTPPTPAPGTPGTAAPSSDITGSPVSGLLILQVAGLLVAAGVLTAGVAMIAAPVAAAMVALVATAAVTHHAYLATETHRTEAHRRAEPSNSSQAAVGSWGGRRPDRALLRPRNRNSDARHQRR
ncbi:J domain-containing protein [Pseudonocardia sp. ICBG601]|uniref:J domain-containing protein n=1 Tax=Pseudonocardia sp. ICBG601 TaxID=2846759 RepID=UPI001CF715D4|nr:J domain-containing protein [Pseudonocardia sp. ICBG601]